MLHLRVVFLNKYTMLKLSIINDIPTVLPKGGRHCFLLLKHSRAQKYV